MGEGERVGKSLHKWLSHYKNDLQDPTWFRSRRLNVL